MPIPKNYFHDKLVLLLLSIMTFLVLLCGILLFLRLDTEREGYIIQYRSNLGLSAFTTGSTADMTRFVIFTVLVAAFHLVLSMKIYHRRRELSIMVLATGILLQVITIIVSNALLVLR